MKTKDIHWFYEYNLNSVLLLIVLLPLSAQLSLSFEYFVDLLFETFMHIR